MGPETVPCTCPCMGPPTTPLMLPLYLYILVNRAADRARYVAADARALLDETATYWDYVEAETVLAERQPCVRVYLTQTMWARRSCATCTRWWNR